MQSSSYWKSQTLSPSIPTWSWDTCYPQCPMQRWTYGPGLNNYGTQSPDYNIRPSTRYLILPQAGTHTPPSEKSSSEIFLDKKTKEWLSPFFFWILPCLDPTGHRRKCSRKHTKGKRETEKERKGNREVGSAGLKLWTPHCDGLHNWPQFSPLPVLYPPLFQFPPLPWGEWIFSHSDLWLDRECTLANEIWTDITPQGLSAFVYPLPSPSFPSLNLLKCEQVQQRWAELGQPPTHVWAK